MSQPGANRTLTWWPIAGAAAVALVGVLAIVIFGSGGQSQYGLKTDADGALSCPPQYTVQIHQGTSKVVRAWVPIAATGIDDGKSLVPDGKPQFLTICQYPAHKVVLDRSLELSLEGHKTVTKNTKQAAQTLSALAAAPKPNPACATKAGPTYLLGLLYPTGEIWVAYPDNGCQYATNGNYQTATNFRPAVESAFQTGSWG